MPVADSFQTKAPEVPTPMPADMYQVQLMDVTSSVEVSPFTGKEAERMTWTFMVLDEGEYYGRILRAWTPNKWFINPKSGIKSGYFAIAEGVLAGYGTKADQAFGETLNPNDLIGKQVRVTVNITDKGDRQVNKIVAYMPIKKELKGVDPVKFQTEQAQRQQQQKK